MMNAQSEARRRRVLVIDDNSAIHDDFRKILCPARPRNSSLSEMEMVLFGKTSEVAVRERFDVDFAFQGQDGLSKVLEGMQGGNPYAMAFVDIRMPPGWDGIETISKIWNEYPELQIVICSAYSDYSWSEIINKLGHTDRLIILRKPFDTTEVLQLAYALTEKWRLARQAKEEIERTKATQALLRESQAWNAAVLQSALDSIIIVDAKGTIRDLNPAAEKTFGYSKASAVGKDMSSLIIPDSMRAKHRQGFQRYLSTGQAVIMGLRVELQALRADGTEFPVELAVTRLNTEGPPIFAGFVRDCSKQKQAQAALLESNERYELVIRGTNEGMWDWNIETNKVKFNPRWKAMLGYEEHEIKDEYSEWERRLHPESSEKVVASLNAFLASREDMYELEHRLQHKDGTYRWVLARGIVLRRPDGTPYRMAGSNIDLTARKEAEEKLLSYQRDMQKLTSELALSEENERRHFATALHDRIGQDLSFCYFKLEAIAATAAGSKFECPINEIQKIINTLLQETRSLTFEMSPPVLYEIGLESALEWLAEDMQQRYGFNCRLEVQGDPCPLEARNRIVLFQSVRELLHNAGKHSRAKTVEISIHRNPARWRVSVSDDGIGIAAGNRQSKSGMRGFGIFSVRERLKYLGGSLEYSTATPAGTCVVIDLPIRNQS